MREYGVSGMPSGPGQLLSLDEVRPLSRSQNIETVELNDERPVISWEAIEGLYTDIFARTLASETAFTGPDFDGDGIPDAIDEDEDDEGDGLADPQELSLGSLTLSPDSTVMEFGTAHTPSRPSPLKTPIATATELAITPTPKTTMTL